ncbi:MAG TPA: dicarboxylate/amino acid:cation symporter [Megamonas hypermegale]|nr:dicarboxylate/amino acid:cation symporter [Megamonas hypermegale]
MNLSIKIFISLLLSVIVGLILGEENLPWLKAYIAPIGTMFINLIKMIIVPVVLSSLVCGVASLGDTKKLGRIGIKVILLYLVTTAIALIIGLGLASILQPGVSMNLVPEKAPEITEAPTFMTVLVNMIPANPIMSMATADMLPIIVFALAIGIGITAVGQKGQPLLNFFDSLAEVSYKLISMIMSLAPYGVFALLVPVVAENGPKVLLPLLSVIVTVYIGCILHALIVYSSIVSALGKISPIKFFKGMTEAMLLAFTTCSSAATLPINMKNCEEKLGANKSVASFVLPLGATINMDGTAIYQGVCAIFIANIYGIDLTMSQMIMIIISGTLASVGTAGVPGAGVIMLALVLQTVGLPMEGIALVAGIDRVLDMIRTCLNITGDAAVTVAVSQTEKGK